MTFEATLKLADAKHPWRPVWAIAAGITALLVASPLGMIGSAALGFVIPTGWAAPWLGLGMVLIPVWLFGAIVLPATLIIAAVRSRRIELAAAAMGVCLLMWGTKEPAQQLVQWSVYRGLSTVAKSGAPITRALEQYHAERGAYPETLEDLIPKYLREVPDTRLAAFPEFEYFRSTDNQNPKGYDLSVSFSRGLFDFSAYQYWPHQDYPRDWPRTSPEIVGTWAIYYD